MGAHWTHIFCHIWNIKIKIKKAKKKRRVVNQRCKGYEPQWQQWPEEQHFLPDFWASVLTEQLWGLGQGSSASSGSGYKQGTRSSGNLNLFWWAEGTPALCSEETLPSKMVYSIDIHTADLEISDLVLNADTGTWQRRSGTSVRASTRITGESLHARARGLFKSTNNLLPA